MGNIPNSGLFNYDKEKETIILNSIGKIDFKELFMESLTPKFLKLFKGNINLFYSKPFAEGISYEYGLFNKSKNMKKAFEIYKDAADNKYDYLCMYRMNRIFLTDYKSFDLEKNGDLHRLYLYKCFAYLPYVTLDRSSFILNKIDVTKEIDIILDKFENNRYDIFNQFMEFLEKNKKQFNITVNDIYLMKSIFKCYFSSKLIQEDITYIDNLLDFNKEKGENVYFEAQLKYCNFYLEYSKEKCDNEKINNIFDYLIKSGYYKAVYDYGQFLKKEKKYEEAKSMFKKGFDNAQRFCLNDYTNLLINLTYFNNFLTDYSLISYILKNMCLIISFDKLGISNFYYTIYYLIKHSSFKQKILNDFSKYVKEMFQNEKKYLQIEKNELIDNNFAEVYTI